MSADSCEGQCASWPPTRNSFPTFGKHDDVIPKPFVQHPAEARRTQGQSSKDLSFCLVCAFSNSSESAADEPVDRDLSRYLSLLPHGLSRLGERGGSSRIEEKLSPFHSEQIRQIPSSCQLERIHHRRKREMIHSSRLSPTLSRMLVVRGK